MVAIARGEKTRRRRGDKESSDSSAYSVLGGISTKTRKKKVTVLGTGEASFLNKRTIWLYVGEATNAHMRVQRWIFVFSMGTDTSRPAVNGRPAYFLVSRRNMGGKISWSPRLGIPRISVGQGRETLIGDESGLKLS